jgi:predicted outer membrane protein
MTLKSIAAVFAILLLPLAASAQDAPKPTKAAAQQVVKTIGGDKAKLKIYCEMGKLDEQIGAADQKKDTKTVDELTKRMDDMAQQLGAEYLNLMQGLQGLDPDSKQAQEIGGVLDALDQQCGK